MFLVGKLHTLFENIFYFNIQHLPVRTYVYNDPYRKIVFRSGFCACITSEYFCNKKPRNLLRGLCYIEFVSSTYSSA